MSAPHDVAIRASAPPQSSRTLDGSHQTSMAGASSEPPRASGSEVWAGAISRLQTQVSYNTSLLHDYRQKVQDIENAITTLNQAVRTSTAQMNDLRAEPRTRPSSGPPRPEFRADPDDLQVLAEQVGTITNRVNEVDALRMQVRLLENRMKRYEEHGVQPAAARPSADLPSRESAFRGPAAPVPGSGMPQPPILPSSHQPLPPMRTAEKMSPVDNRPLPSSDLRHPSMGSTPTFQASSASGFRPGDVLPPASALWRSVESLPSSSSSGVPPPPLPGPSRPPVLPSEPPGSGWAAVNAAQTAKRPFEEPRQSPYESSIPGSPKRPKLAPIMPRSTYSDESSYVPSNVPKSSVDSYGRHSRAPSDSSQTPSQFTAPTPSAQLPGHRFIMSTQSADSQESWRPESERSGPAHHPHAPHGPGRRGGRGSRGRGRGRGRGGVVLDARDVGTPEWERADWTGSQISSNGYYHPLHQQPRSPEDAARGGPVRRSGGADDFPATPLTGQTPHDPFAPGYRDGTSEQPTSASKKTRTKPIRNAEGILIRKDGRPDMRSVSSANNLRKVHAKKEAERAENEGRTPTSARSAARIGSVSEDGEEEAGDEEGSVQQEEEVTDAQRRHRELMSRMFPSGAEEASRRVGERFFPAQERHDSGEGVAMKVEEGSEERAPPREAEPNSQMTDVVMKEMADTEGREGKGEEVVRDPQMPTVEEERGEE